MGFLELAAALKFLGNADIALFPGDPMFFNYDTVLCSWIAIAFACGLYLFGLFRLPHDSKVESLGVVRMLFGTIFIGLAIHMLPALSREQPLGAIGRGLVAFLPLDTRPSKEHDAEWTKDYTAAWDQAVKEKKLIFIDFTGVTCTNCRANEKNVFPLPRVKKEMEKYVRVQLYTDSVPDSRLSRSEADAQAKRNQQWQDNTFGDLTNPLYVILQPDASGAEDNGKLKGTERGRYSGLINNPDDFVKFLQNPAGPAAR
jgi:thiol:disulfide interchange protein DsbD